MCAGCTVVVVVTISSTTAFYAVIMRSRSTHLILQPLRHIEQLATVNGISTRSSNSTWSNMFNLALETCRTNRNLVTSTHLATTCKRAGRAAIGDCTNCGRWHISSVCCSCTTRTQGNSICQCGICPYPECNRIITRGMGFGTYRCCQICRLSRNTHGNPSLAGRCADIAITGRKINQVLAS